MPTREIVINILKNISNTCFHAEDCESCPIKCICERGVFPPETWSDKDIERVYMK